MDENTPEQSNIAAIIVAAGQATRMEGIDKVFAPLLGRPLLLWTVRPFQDCSSIGRIVVVVSREKEKRSLSLLTGPDWSKVTDVCPGGARRQDSVAAGLERLGRFDWVVIQDGARPLVTVDLIESGLEAARETGAAVAAVPVTDTIKMVDPNEIVLGTPPRENLRAVQTPQVFRSDLIDIGRYRAAEAVTDDASLVEKLGHRVKLYPGSYDNIKVTAPDDLARAEIILRKRGFQHA